MESAATPFSDVKASDWYNEEVLTARNYKLIDGFNDGTFRPLNTITREQAMKLTKLEAKLVPQKSEELLGKYADADRVSEWAREGLTSGLLTAIITGRTDTLLVPQDQISRAEVAAIVQRLLQKSNLINE
jgi:hypothetical protein